MSIPELPIEMRIEGRGPQTPASGQSNMHQIPGSFVHAYCILPSNKNISCFPEDADTFLGFRLLCIAVDALLCLLHLYEAIVTSAQSHLDVSSTRNLLQTL